MQEQSLMRTILFDLDLLIFVAALLLTGFAHQILSTRQTIQPFYPSEASLWNPYQEDTIHIGALFVVHYVILTPMIYVLELKGLEKVAISWRRKRLLALRLAFGMWAVTMVAIFAVELSKGYVGRLRPHFASTCLGPPPYAAEVLNKVIRSDTECNPPDAKLLHDARRSFPSGHAALGFGGAGYAQLCMIRFAVRQEGIMSVVTMMFGWGLMVFGGWVGASRVADHAHHVSDVAFGSIIGLWAAGLHFWFVVARTSRAVEDAVAHAQQTKAD